LLIALNPLLDTGTVMEAHRLTARIKDLEDASLEIDDWEKVVSSQTAERMECLQRLWQFQTLPRLALLKAVRKIIADTTQDQPPKNHCSPKQIIAGDERLRLIVNAMHGLQFFEDGMGPDWAWMSHKYLSDACVAGMRRSFLGIGKELEQQPCLDALAKLPDSLSAVHGTVAVRVVSLKTADDLGPAEYTIVANVVGKQQSTSLEAVGTDPRLAIEGTVPYQELQCTLEDRAVRFVVTGTASWMSSIVPSWSMTTGNIRLKPGSWHRLEETRCVPLYVGQEPASTGGTGAEAPSLVVEFHFACCPKHLVPRQDTSLHMNALDSMASPFKPLASPVKPLAATGPQRVFFPVAADPSFASNRTKRSRLRPPAAG